MNHPTDLLPDYLLGLLSPEEVERLEVHLEGCSSCRADLVSLSEPIVALTEALPQINPPEHVWEGLQERFRNEAKQATVLTVPNLKPRPPYEWLLAACFTLFLGSSFWGYQSFTNFQQARSETLLLTRFLSDAEVQKVSLEPLLDSGGTSPGSVLISPREEVLFVLDAPPAGRSYQAWGHNSSDWNPDKGDILDSLNLSSDGVFEVQAAGFAALYLSLEPAGGSPQPTNPLSKLSLNARPNDILDISTPEDGATLSSASVIVRGLLADEVQDLSYNLNDGEPNPISFANNSFSFTLMLEPGENALEVTASTGADSSSTTLTLIYSD